METIQKLIEEAESIKIQMCSVFYLYMNTTDLELLDSYKSLYRQYATVILEISTLDPKRVLAFGRAALELARQAEQHIEALESINDATVWEEINRLYARYRLLLDQAAAALGESLRPESQPEPIPPIITVQVVPIISVSVYCPPVTEMTGTGCLACKLKHSFREAKSACEHIYGHHPDICNAQFSAKRCGIRMI